jgi:predicted AAA+ superfamily ATPase
MSDNIKNIREIYALLLNRVDLQYKRFLYNRIDFDQRLIGIIGPRGVGKTTLILQYLKENHADNPKAIYLLADNVFFEKNDLFNFVRDFYLKQGGRLVCIDEIHRYENWNQELKNIYDSFPDMKIIFSGSSSVDLVQGKHDLSRRGVVYNLPGFSFREYLLFETGQDLEVFSLDDIFSEHEKINMKLAKIENVLMHFNNYLSVGYYPFYRETKEVGLYYQKINNVIDKIIYEDITSFYKLKTQNLVVFKQMLVFLATISPGEVNVHKLANSLGKNYETVANYLEILNEASLVRFLGISKSGYALIRTAKKVYLDNTNLYGAINFNLGKEIQIGTMRENFMLNQLQNAGLNPTFSNVGDMKVSGVILEIGGKNKKIDQIKNIKSSFLVVDDILVGNEKQLPLYMFGFLY